MNKDIIILKQIVMEALGMELGHIDLVAPAGGLTNKSYKVHIENKDYIIRLPGAGTAQLINRTDEKINTKLINDLKIDGNLIYFNPHTGVKISEFIEGAKELTCQTARLNENMVQVAETLKTLHTSGIVMNNSFNVFDKIVSYEGLLEEAGGEFFPDYIPIRRSIMDLEYILKDYNVPVVACHNDTVPGNFIRNYEGRIYLIDWEYSGMNDNMWDLASYSLRCDFSQDEEEQLLNLYFNGEVEEHYKSRVAIYKICQDLLWAIWALYKQTQGEDFSDYALQRYSRAKKNLKNFIPCKLQLNIFVPAEDGPSARWCDAVVGDSPSQQ